MCSKNDIIFLHFNNTFYVIVISQGGAINFNASILQLRFSHFWFTCFIFPFCFAFTSLLCIRVFFSFLLSCFLSLSLCHQSGRILNRVFQATSLKELLLFIYLLARI